MANLVRRARACAGGTGRGCSRPAAFSRCEGRRACVPPPFASVACALRTVGLERRSGAARTCAAGGAVCLGSLLAVSWTHAGFTGECSSSLSGFAGMLLCRRQASGTSPFARSPGFIPSLPTPNRDCLSASRPRSGPRLCWSLCVRASLAAPPLVYSQQPPLASLFAAALVSRRCQGRSWVVLAATALRSLRAGSAGVVVFDSTALAHVGECRPPSSHRSCSLGPAPSAPPRMSLARVPGIAQRLPGPPEPISAAVCCCTCFGSVPVAALFSRAAGCGRAAGMTRRVLPACRCCRASALGARRLPAC